MPVLLPSVRHVVAHNDAKDSGNPVHDEDVAKRLNFSGALVPGVTVFGYMTHGLLEHYGESWLDRGRMHVRFRRPVYAGQKLLIHSTSGEDVSTADLVDIRVTNQNDEACALGSGSLPTSMPGSAVGPLPPPRDLPRRKWPARRERLLEERVLGSITAVFEKADTSEFLTAMQDKLDVYRSGVVHPAWLLRQANLIVDGSVDVGPWIHVESDIQNYNRGFSGRPIEIRAQVVKLFERKGHDYADLDVVLLDGNDTERILMRVLHRVIYRLGQPAD